MTNARTTIRAVVFDQDGTLINTFGPALAAYSAATGREITLAELLPVAHLGAARNLVSALLGRAATDADDDVFHDALAAAIAGIDPYPGVVPLLATLREAGLRTGVATNSDTRSSAVVLGAHGLDAWFDTVVCVDQAGAPKPDPACLLLAAQRLGVAPDEVMFVGDSRADMAAARAVGSVAVVAGWGMQAMTIDPDEADHWADHPEDVARLLGLDPTG